MQKLLTFFQQKNIRILYIESAKTVNEMTLNELVKLTTLWTTGPWYQTTMAYKTKINEPGYNISYKCPCAPSEDSDQPAHPRSLIRVLTSD